MAIYRRLGLKASLLTDALRNLSEDAQKFENIVRSAEESRIKADETLRECNRLKAEWAEKIQLLENEREKLKKEKEKLYVTAKAESRRIINERASEAEELLTEIEKIFAKENMSETDLIKARTLKNRLNDKVYEGNEEESVLPQYVPVTADKLRVGDKVYVKNTAQEGVVQNVRANKGEAEVLCGNIRLRCKILDLSLVIHEKKEQTKGKQTKWSPKKNNEKVQVSKKLTPKPAPTLEINVIGLTVHEAIPEVEAFIDSAVIANLEEVRIVHGVGTGKLRAGIHDFLRTHRNVDQYRFGKYGEGETGVTIVKIK